MRGEVNVMQADILPVRSRAGRDRPHAAHPEHRAQFVIGARHRWSTNSL